MPAKHIMVVDDDRAVRVLLAHALALLEPGGAVSGQVDLLLTDVNMPGLSGLQLVDALKAEGLALPTLVMSANGGPQLAAEVTAHGCVGQVDKPFSVQELLTQIGRILQTPAACPATR